MEFIFLSKLMLCTKSHFEKEAKDNSLFINGPYWFETSQTTHTFKIGFKIVPTDCTIHRPDFDFGLNNAYIHVFNPLKTIEFFQETKKKKILMPSMVLGLVALTVCTYILKYTLLCKLKLK